MNIILKRKNPVHCVSDMSTSDEKVSELERFPSRPLNQGEQTFTFSKFDD